jgi:uncharacterized SAM-binding protein YcdF (DUF218 family)
VRTAVKTLTGVIGGAAFALTAGLILFAASINHYEPAISRDAPADAIVVLTGGESRIQEGLRLFSEARTRRILISGVNKHTTRDDLRRQSGLPSTLFDCCVDIGYAAQDTIGNAAETQNWAQIWGFTNLIVVTSNYHMPRGLSELSRVLPDVALTPHPVVSRSYRAEHWWLHPSAIRLVVSEYLKYIPSAARLVMARAVGASDAMPGEALLQQGLPAGLSTAAALTR